MLHKAVRQRPNMATSDTMTFNETAAQWADPILYELSSMSHLPWTHTRALDN